MFHVLVFLTITISGWNFNGFLCQHLPYNYAVLRFMMLLFHNVYPILRNLWRPLEWVIHRGLQLHVVSCSFLLIKPQAKLPRFSSYHAIRHHTHTHTYPFIFFPFLTVYFISLLRSVPALLNFHFVHSGQGEELYRNLCLKIPQRGPVVLKLCPTCCRFDMNVISKENHPKIIEISQWSLLCL
jgi:hypothetical protein